MYITYIKNLNLLMILPRILHSLMQKHAMQKLFRNLKMHKHLYIM